MNTIPPITDPVGKYWEQPNPAGILVDDTHALMDAKAFEALHEYSCSQPSGVYPGKMWKGNAYAYKRGPGGLRERWYLHWFGDSDKGPDWCSNNTREILIA